MQAVFRHLLRTLSSPRPAVSGEGADIRRGEAKGSKSRLRLLFLVALRTFRIYASHFLSDLALDTSNRDFLCRRRDDSR